MEQETLLKNGYDLVYLTGCALRGEMPEVQRVEAMDLEAVFALSRNHSMSAVCAYAMESFCKANQNHPAAQNPVVGTWVQDKLQAIRKNLLLDMERERILAYLEQLGCWHMPLKGVFLQQIYPRAGMRQMSDNDILIDPAFRKTVEAFMLENGYEVSKDGRDIHDEFLKKPVYNFEMHTALLPRQHSDLRAEYYQNVKEKLLKDQEDKHSYRFSDEDFYIFMTVHAAKHYETSGTGVRSLMDTFVYLRQKGEGMDRQYIDRELKLLDLTEYERAVARLADKLFGTGESLSEEETALFLYHVSSGTYGKYDIRISNGLKKLTGNGQKITFWVRVKYSLRRLFPPVSFYADYAPLAYRYKILIPFVAVYRLVSRIFSPRSRFWKEVKETWSPKDRTE